MVQPRIYPTCRICVRLNAESTHCAVFGALTPDEADDTAIGHLCSVSGHYVRLLHAEPNSHNLKAPEDVHAAAGSPMSMFDAADESNVFQVHHGMSLEDWAASAFGAKKPE